MATKAEKDAAAAAELAKAGAEGGEVAASELEPVAPEKVVTAPAATQTAPAKAKVTVLKVRCPGNVAGGPVGGSIRTFSTADHGDTFKDDAEAYRVRYNGEYVK